MASLQGDGEAERRLEASRLSARDPAPLHPVGRGSCWERGEVSGVAVSFKKKRRQASLKCEGSSGVCSSDLDEMAGAGGGGRGTPGGLERQVLLSPVHGAVNVEWHRSKVTVKPKEGWKPRVYRLEILPGFTQSGGGRVGKEGKFRGSPYHLKKKDGKRV